MVSIRQNVFETNSSSTHSLAYKVDPCTGRPNNPEVDYDIRLYDFYGDDPKKGLLAIHFDNYGWSGDPCDDFKRKLSYLMTQTVQGISMRYYGNQYDASGKKIEGEKEIEIETQEDWDNVINNYVLKDPKVLKILNVIKEKCPHIKGFKFYWYNPEDSWELKNRYRAYYNLSQEEDSKYHLTDNLSLEDEFFHNYKNNFSGHKYLIGFGSVDHQSIGLLNNMDYIEQYLFDDNFEVVITHDNR